MKKEKSSINEENNQKANIDIRIDISENINFPEIYNIFKDRYNIDSSFLFNEQDLIKYKFLSKENINSFIIKREGFFKSLFYNSNGNESPILRPKLITFEKNKRKETYKICRNEFFLEVYNSFNFKNPICIEKNKISSFIKEKYLEGKYREDNIKIEETIEPNYKDLYKEKYIRNGKGRNIFYNFKYYFSSPSEDEEFSILVNEERQKKYEDIFTFKEKKIKGICGPQGAGKTTTLLLSKGDEKKNTCYFNIKALNLNSDKINIWKNEILLYELYNIFKNYNTNMFEQIKNKIKLSKDYWESIYTCITFCVEKKINSIFIIDQYKQKLDINYIYLKRIKELIEDIKNKNVKIIVSSSLNNKEISKFFLSSYLNDINKPIIDYEYYCDLFLLGQIPNYLNALNGKKKKIFLENFANVPSYYFEILETKDNNLDNLVTITEDKITKQMGDFFKVQSNNNVDNLYLLITSFAQYGKNAFNEDLIIKLIKIIPLKFFILKFSGNTIIDIDFYFPLAKLCYLNFINKIIISLLSKPTFPFQSRTIGALLEIQVIEYLKRNKFDTFSQICNVNEIWNLKEVDNFNKNKVKNELILIIQNNPNGELVDFGFLIRGEILILCQCKKVLQQIPNNYINIDKIKERKNIITFNFEEIFGIKIKRIYLFYMTGIIINNLENSDFHPWSYKEENFNTLIKMTETMNIKLVYFDVVNKQLLIQYGEEFYTFNSICADSSPVRNNVSYVDINISDYRITDTIELMKSLIQKSYENAIITGITLTEKKLFENYFNQEISGNEIIEVNDSFCTQFWINSPNYATTFSIRNINYVSKYNEDEKKVKFYRKMSDSIVPIDIFSDISKVNSFKIIKFLGKKHHK